MKEKTDNLRRDFLKKAAIGTAGAGLVTSFSAKSYASILGANDRVNVEIVGFSNRARNSLIPAFHIHNKELNFRVTAVSDIWNRRRDECVDYMKPNLLEEASLVEKADKVVTGANTGVDNMTSRHMRNRMECVRDQNPKTNAPARVGYNHSIANIMTTTALHTGKKVAFDDANQEIIIS